MTKYQRIGDFDFFLLTIYRFLLTKCYLFALFPVKMLLAFLAVLCGDACLVFHAAGGAWLPSVELAPVLFSDHQKKVLFFCKKVCNYFAVYKKSSIFVYDLVRATLDARKLSGATASPGMAVKIESYERFYIPLYPYCSSRRGYRLCNDFRP